MHRKTSSSIQDKPNAHSYLHHCSFSLNQVQFNHEYLTWHNTCNPWFFTQCMHYVLSGIPSMFPPNGFTQRLTLYIGHKDVGYDMKEDAITHKMRENTRTSTHLRANSLLIFESHIKLLCTIQVIYLRKLKVGCLGLLVMAG